MSFEKIEKRIEMLTSKPISEIRDLNVEDLRKYLERKNSKTLVFKSEFQTVGRGNVLRDNIITSAQLDEEIDAILKHSK
jgi:hypothetical protein